MPTTTKDKQECPCRWHWQAYIPRRRFLIQLLAAAAGIALVFAANVVLLWLALSGVSIWYTVKNTKRSFIVRRNRLATHRAPHSEVFLAAKRYEQELVDCFVVFCLFGLGILALFITPIQREAITYIEIVLPLFLIAAHIGIAFRSYMVHSNHHTVVNMLTAEHLERQLLEHLLEKHESDPIHFRDLPE